MFVETEHGGKQRHIRQTGGKDIIQAGGIFYETEILVDGADQAADLLLLPFCHGGISGSINQKRTGCWCIHAV